MQIQDEVFILSFCVKKTFITKKKKEKNSFNFCLKEKDVEVGHTYNKVLV